VAASYTVVMRALADLQGFVRDHRMVLTVADHVALQGIELRLQQQLAEAQEPVGGRA